MGGIIIENDFIQDAFGTRRFWLRRQRSQWASGSSVRGQLVDTPLLILWRNESSVGVVPSIRRNVRVRWAASEKPALCAACVTVCPSIKSQHARWSRSPQNIGTQRNADGFREDVHKTCLRETRYSGQSLERQIIRKSHSLSQVIYDASHFRMNPDCSPSS
jgi:hypothetical protein